MPDVARSHAEERKRCRYDEEFGDDHLLAELTALLSPRRARYENDRIVEL